MTDARKATIVAIDDQPSVLHTITSMLAPFNNVMPLISGRALLGYMREQTADLILMDYQMPELSGIELMEDKKTCGIPIIFFTSSEDADTEVKVLEKGAADYIQKPVKEYKEYQAALNTLVAAIARFSSKAFFFSCCVALYCKASSRTLSVSFVF